MLTRSWTLYRLVEGHYPYGAHRLIAPSQHARYFVILRDPVERVISAYHHILRSRERKNPHPLLEEVLEHDLVDFYRLPRHQNMQARAVAGMFFRRIGMGMSINRWKPLVLWVARRNLLQTYEAFGLTERFEASARLFAEKLGWTYHPSSKRYHKAPDRPTKADLTQRQVQELRRLNSIDMALYETAREHFDRQLSPKTRQRQSGEQQQSGT